MISFLQEMYHVVGPAIAFPQNSSLVLRIPENTEPQRKIVGTWVSEIRTRRNGYYLPSITKRKQYSTDEHFVLFAIEFLEIKGTFLKLLNFSRLLKSYSSFGKSRLECTSFGNLVHTSFTNQMSIQTYLNGVYYVVLPINFQKFSLVAIFQFQRK